MKNLEQILVIAFIFSASFLVISCTNDENQISQQDKLSLILEKVDDKNIIEISLSSDNEYSFIKKDAFISGFLAKAAAPGDIVCQGKGYSFAKCVGKALDSGLTLKVYKKGGEYYAEEM